MAAAVAPGASPDLRALDLRYPLQTDAAVNAALAPMRPSSAPATSASAPASAAAGDMSLARRLFADEGDGADVAPADASLTTEQASLVGFIRDTFVASGAAPCGDSMLTLGLALTAPAAGVRRMVSGEHRAAARSCVASWLLYSCTCIGARLIGALCAEVSLLIPRLCRASRLCAKALEQLEAQLAGAPVSGADSDADGEAAPSDSAAYLVSAALARLADDDLEVVVAAGPALPGARRARGAGRRPASAAGPPG